MVFIYPASITENCDKRIVPAVAKSIERFFCTQICDAIADGVLPLSRKWDGRRYGAIVMECVNNYNKKQALTESCKYLTEATHHTDPIDGNRTPPPNQTPPNPTNRPHGGRDPYYDNIRAWADINKVKTDIHKVDIEEDKLDMAKEKHGWEREEHGWRGEKNEREAAKERRDKEDWVEQKERERYSSGGGSYLPLETRIDIVPTGMTVEVPVQYVGGRLDGKMQDEVRININVKVIPTIIKNFKILEKDLLNDAFTRKSESYFVSKGRNIARKCYNILKKLPFEAGDAIWEKGMMTINGDDVTRESRKDIIYNSQGFVNASAFHKTSKSPNNYNYTSNIVVFNKDDLTDPDDANIFQNRSAMNKLFKLGWSTFCMLDPVEELMYFISSLDGGFMHIIPYRYLMESYGSRAYYGTETRLKDTAKPFLVKRGNFLSFAKQFTKKSKK